jgi:hypothetical protein
MVDVENFVLLKHELELVKGPDIKNFAWEPFENGKDNNRGDGGI